MSIVLKAPKKIEMILLKITSIIDRNTISYMLSPPRLVLLNSTNTRRSPTHQFVHSHGLYYIIKERLSH